MGLMQAGWRLSIEQRHAVAARTGQTVFVGGAGDFDKDGRIRHPGDLRAQIDGTISNLQAALALEGATVADGVRFKVYYTPANGMDEWAVRAAIQNHGAFASLDPLPALSMMPVPLQPFEGQAVQIQAIAIVGWRHGPRAHAISRAVPASAAKQFDRPIYTVGLRADEFFTAPLRCAIDENGKLLHKGDGVAQSHAIMSDIETTLMHLGAGMQDAIKMEGYYFGTTHKDWAPLGAARASHFREPGPVATVVPCHVLDPDGAATKIEVMGFRGDNGVHNKYIPREDRWPDTVWDWSLPLPYRQGLRLRNQIWTGGQVPYDRGTTADPTIYPTDMLKQTRFTMGLCNDIVEAFDRSTRDYRLLVCYFTSKGTEKETRTFVDQIAAEVDGRLPPMTIVPQPHMHTDDCLVEIWGIAQG
jgi:enamine deaminase RidA (YjgF/YER057c/UK114 family)